MKGMHAQGGLPIPGIVHIDQPYHFGEGQGMSAHEFGLERARQLEQKILELGVDKVAAFIGEPIQGAGVSSFRLTATGRRSSASAITTASCSSPTR